MSKTLYAKSAPEWTSLEDHTNHVIMSVIAFARYLGFDIDVARNGAILHDIGKANSYFQTKRLQGLSKREDVFRHEIASLFFLSAFPKDHWDALIEMVVGHHKSVLQDNNEMGLLDLRKYSESYIKFHLGNWDEWSVEAIALLNILGVSSSSISKEQAVINLQYCINYCEVVTKEKGYSEWRGLLIGADHFASSMIDKTEQETDRIFKTPVLDFYNRQHPLYPLSYKDADSSKKHTIVIACTGAGKTDFLFRRCVGRVFYTLPFQASINAMFKRVGNDLEKDNPNIDIRVLHSTSVIVKRKKEEAALQNLMGSAVKILTPHQLATIALGMKGYEAMILDIKGCDVILDEVHTYSGVSQALVLKIIEVLKAIDCRIHVGTATMPTILYNRLKELLGDDVLEVKLDDEELDQFDRHIVHKLSDFEAAKGIINQAVHDNKKILVVMNTVKNAQNVYDYIQEVYDDVSSLLLHSKFKRGDRNRKEKQLLGLEENGKPTYEFNTSDKACIVVSTQIVEVSLDISFDMMITATAPLDALIQRFGRINRKRNQESIGKLKDVYVIAPAETEKEVRPYDLHILQKSFEVLDDGQVLKERDLQTKIDQVFAEINFLKIEEHSVFKSDGRFTINKLMHRSKAILFELLEIDSVSCITEEDVETYENGDFETRLNLEIPVAYWSVDKMEQSKKGNKPFIIPDQAYDQELGLEPSKIKQENFNVLNRFL